MYFNYKCNYCMIGWLAGYDGELYNQTDGN